jgi:hypothetical protein
MADHARAGEPPTTVAASASTPLATQDTDVVLLRVAPELRSVTTRVSGELRSLGFFVVLADSTQNSLAEAALDARAVAAVSLAPDGASTTITVLDRVTNKLTQRSLSIRAGDAEEVIALGTAELLRVSLMEVVRPVPPRGAVAPSPRVLSLATASSEANRRPPARFALGFRAGALAPRGVAPALEMEVVVHGRVLPWLELGAAGAMQLTEQRLAADEGEIEILSRRLMFTFGTRWLDYTAWQLSSHVALGTTYVMATGIASSSASRGRSDAAWLPSGELGAEGRRLLLGSLWATVTPSVGFSTREAALHGSSRQIGRWGNAWARVALGVEVQWR